MFQKNKIIILIVALLGAAGAFFYRPQQTYAAGFSGMTFYHRFLINCWGDSMTAGQGGNGVTYPRVLKELTGFPVNNFGVSGETTYEIVDRSAEYGDQSGDIMIIEMGDNGTWRNMDDLIKQYQNMLDEADCSNYIIISSTDDPNDTDQIWGESGYEPGMRDTWYEAALKDAFGEHVVTVRKYLIENGLSINGLDETDEDRERAEKGLISLQLRNYWIDNTHLNGYGYRAQAHAVYEKGIELGYWFANGGDVTSDGWIVVEDDVIQADYTGMALNEYGWWYFKDGVLDENYTGMAVNEYGWWYMTNGALDLNYTGMAINEYGTWYMVNGFLASDFTGTVHSIKVVNGLVVEHAHNWQHHDAVYGEKFIPEENMKKTEDGYYFIDDGWERVEEAHIICGTCKKDFGPGDDAVEKWAEHALSGDFYTGCQNYFVDWILVGEKCYTLLTPAYDECTECGVTRR